LFEDLVFFPKGQDFFFQFGEIDPRVYRFIQAVPPGKQKNKNTTSLCHKGRVFSSMQEKGKIVSLTIYRFVRIVNALKGYLTGRRDPQPAIPPGTAPAGAEEAQAEMLANRLRKRFRHLKKWAKRIGTDLFRLYDRDIPEIPLVLDWYGGALAGALYKRPYEKDGAEEERWLDLMKEAAAEALGIESSRVFIKLRQRQRGAAQYRRMEGGGVVREVSEGGLRFRVNLSDYLDTGLFPDRRRLRALIREEAAGKRVLNLFCYTASFSVYAAAGGAAEIDSVDLSNTYLDWGLENFRLNGFTGTMVSEERIAGRRQTESRRPPAGVPERPLSTADGHCPGVPLPPFRFIRADVLTFLGRAFRAGLRWDLIILDPPAFSNSKKMRRVLDVQRDHPGLVRDALRLLAPGGRLWFSTGTRHFRPDQEKMAEMAVLFPGLRLEERGNDIVDEDFRGKIPPCYLFRI
jgi:23S rRNA G2069 N7-methylase RlmK/C1962 C5-methylase RlmI